MDAIRAEAMFQAMGQGARLGLLRLLIAAGPDGLAAGDVARRLGVRPNTLSAQLARLQAAGLVQSLRDGRSIRYHADMAAVRGLVGWLIADCCGGDVAACAPVLGPDVCGVGGVE